MRRTEISAVEKLPPRAKDCLLAALDLEYSAKIPSCLMQLGHAAGVALSAFSASFSAASSTCTCTILLRTAYSTNSLTL